MDATVATSTLGLLPAELLCEAVDIHPGERVLVVSADDDAMARAAERRWAQVSTFTEAGTHALPFEEYSFDAVLCGFDVAFDAAELARVCRPAGRVGLLRWRPGPLVGDISRLIGAAPSWADDEGVRGLFGNRVSDVRIVSRHFTFRFRSAQHMLEQFASWHAPTQAAFGGLEPDRTEQLATRLRDAFARHNLADDGTLLAQSEYAEIVAVVR